MALLLPVMLIIAVAVVFTVLAIGHSLFNEAGNALKNTKEKKKNLEKIRLKELELERVREEHEHEKTMKLIESFTSSEDDILNQEV